MRKLLSMAVFNPFFIASNSKQNSRFFVLSTFMFNNNCLFFQFHIIWLMWSYYFNFFHFRKKIKVELSRVESKSWTISCYSPFESLFQFDSKLGLLTFAFYWLSGSDFPVFGKSMYFLLNNVSEALEIKIIH